MTRFQILRGEVPTPEMIEADKRADDERRETRYPSREIMEQYYGLYPRSGPTHVLPQMVSQQRERLIDIAQQQAQPYIHIEESAPISSDAFRQLMGGPQ